MLVYLDWNVFDRLEKVHRLNEDEKIIYSALMDFLKEEEVHTPYSNAHLRDLLRGYKKNPEFINGHLEILQQTTKNLCLCQYWNNKVATLHYRSVSEFFEKLKNEKESEEENFENLIKFDTNGNWEGLKVLLKNKAVPKEFMQIYAQDPIFNIIYPRTKKEKNHLALCSDLHNFSILIRKDYSIYKMLKKFLVISQVKVQKNPEIMKVFKSHINTDAPDYLQVDFISDMFAKNQKLNNESSGYQTMFDTFFRYDLKGYKSDDQFVNMVDDGLHTFYAAHCDYFITNDDKCHYKAEKTYEKLKIGTKVFTAKNFIEHLNS